MECYSGHEGQPPCSSLLGRNTTQAECCCTQGTSWGDTCDLCPTEDSGKAPSGPKSSGSALQGNTEKGGRARLSLSLDAFYSGIQRDLP